MGRGRPHITAKSHENGDLRPEGTVRRAEGRGLQIPTSSQTDHLPDPSIPSHPGSFGLHMAKAGVVSISSSLASSLLLGSYVFRECKLTLASA